MKLWRNIIDFIMGEKLLVILLVLFLSLLLYDHNFVEKLPKYINADALIVIFTLLIISRSLHVSGLTNRVAVKILSHTKNSPRTTLLYMILITYILSPFIMNDGAIFVMVPLVIAVAMIAGHNKALLVTLVTISANLASIILPVGNPQDIVIWTHYGLSLAEYVWASLPLYLLSLGLLIVYIMILPGKLIIHETPLLPRVRLDRRLAAASIVSLAAAITTAQLKSPLIGLIITLILILLTGPRILIGIDYPLFIVFLLMFVDFPEIFHLLGIQSLMGLLTPVQIYGVSLALSQCISNVPATVGLVKYTVYWKPLFAGVNIGGVGFIPGSMANIVALRLSGIKAYDYHKYALPFFVVLGLLGVLLVYAGLYG